MVSKVDNRVNRHQSGIRCLCQLYPVPESPALNLQIVNVRAVIGFEPT